MQVKAVQQTWFCELFEQEPPSPPVRATTSEGAAMATAARAKRVVIALNCILNFVGRFGRERERWELMMSWR